MRGGGTAFSAGFLCEMTAFRIVSDFECRPSDSGIAHVARMAIAGPGWTLRCIGATVHLSTAWVRVAHACLQAWLPSSVSRGVLVADRWSIRAGHRLLPAAVWTLIFPTYRCPCFSHWLRPAGFDTRVGLARYAASSAVNRRHEKVRSVISNPLTHRTPVRAPHLYTTCDPAY